MNEEYPVEMQVMRFHMDELKAENERLRVALERIAHHRDHCVADAMLMSRIARKALESEG